MELPAAWPSWVLIGAIGACVGSFLNVVIVRVPNPGLSLLSPLRSCCPSCGQAIRAYDNVPVLSYLLLRGRCRACRGAIGVLYPVVELLGAIVALGAFALYGAGVAALFAAAFGWLLIVIAACDWRFMEIPLRFPLLGLAAAVAYAGYAKGGEAASRILLEALLVALLLAVLSAAVGRGIGGPALGFVDLLIVALLPALLGLGDALAAVAYAAFASLAWYASLAAKPHVRPWLFATWTVAALCCLVVGGAPLVMLQVGLVVSALLTRHAGVGPRDCPFGTMLCVGAVAAFLAVEPTAFLLNSILPWNSRGVIGLIP